MFRKTTVIAIALASLALAACSVMYDSQQMSSLKSCEKLQNMAEMKDCYQQRQPAFDQYEKQREVLQSGQSEQSSEKQKTPGNCFKRAATGELVCPN
jgi:type II secretory pathway component PulJ